MLPTGTPVPDVSLPDEHGQIVDLAGLRGHWVLLWWYPKAQSPGCTVEGQALRDHADDFDRADVVVLGVSFDTPEENRAFAEAQGFPFHLLSDVSHEAGRRFGVDRPSGDQYVEFCRRHSFLVDPDGVIRCTYDVADVFGHAEAVLADVAALQATADS